MLKANWRSILFRAWSVRLIALAALLSGLEIALPFAFDGFPNIPPLWRAGVMLVLCAGAFIARFITQSNMADD